MSGLPGIDFPGVGTGLAILREGKLLLYRRTRPPEAGHWTIVGGKIDHLEESGVAAMREAEEESGLKVHAVDFLCTCEQIFPEEGHHWVSIIYWTANFSGEPAVMEPEKLPEFGWFDLDSLPEPLSRFAAEAAAHLRRV